MNRIQIDLRTPAPSAQTVRRDERVSQMLSGLAIALSPVIVLGLALFALTTWGAQ